MTTALRGRVNNPQEQHVNRTVQDLQAMAHFITRYGLHTGEQFAAPGPAAPMDICAVAYVIAERCSPPDVFFTDEGASRDLIENSERAMDAIRAISAAITNYEVPDSDGQPDLIEHVSQWTFTSPIGEKTPPSTSEVVGCILRAANNLNAQRAGFTDAWGLCLTCRGHGSLTVDGEEIPYEDLSPRRKQGYDLGHRFYRNTSKPCPDCDGQDRATDAAISAYESTC